MKGEDQMFFSKDKENMFGEIHCSFVIELLSKQWFVKTFLNIVKAVQDELLCNMLSIVGKKCFL